MGLSLQLRSAVLNRRVMWDWSRLRGDVTGGVVGALIAIPFLLSSGAVIYAGIGAEHAAQGIFGALLSAVLFGLTAGVFGGPTLQLTTARTSLAAIVAGLPPMLAAQPAFAQAYPGAAAAPALMTGCLLAVLLSGLLQFGLGALRLGAVVKVIPLPVLAGFVNGTALQIILGQVPKLLGFNSVHQAWLALAGHAPPSPWPLGIACCAGGLMFLPRRLGRVVPLALVALVGGTCAWQLTAKLVAPGMLGPLIGSMPAGVLPLPRFGEMAGFVAAASFPALAPAILGTALTLALVSSMQTLLCLTRSAQIAETAHDANAELRLQGCGNLASALFGGGPSSASVNVTPQVRANGGRGRLANIAFAGSMLLVMLLVGPAIALIPTSAMAAVVIVATLTSFDAWSRELAYRVSRSRGATRLESYADLAIIGLVAVLVVLAGVLVALGVGLALTLLVFLYRSGEQTVRRVLRADGFRSRTTRAEQANAVLAAHGAGIVVVELEGALFFGCIEAVVKRLEAELATAQWLVLDFRRVGPVDSTAVMALKRLDDQMRRQGKRMLLAHLSARSQRLAFMQACGFTAPATEGRVFADTDAALHQAEEGLLASHGGGDALAEAPVPLADFDALRGLGAAELAVVKANLVPRAHAPGETILREGEPGASLFLLSRGWVSGHVGGARLPEAVRLFSYGPGTVFGEMALLSGLARSASVQAETPTLTYELTREALARIAAQVPGIELTLTRNLALELASRVRIQTETIRQLEA